MVIEVFVKHIVPLGGSHFAKRQRLLAFKMGRTQVNAFFYVLDKSAFFFFKISFSCNQKGRGGADIFGVGHLIDNTLFYE